MDLLSWFRRKYGSSAPTGSESGNTTTRLNSWAGGANHTRKGPGVLTSFQSATYKKPGKIAERKRLLKLTGGNRNTGR